MRILILNWRDIRSPRAGGAEVLTHEVARRLAERHEVTWYSSRPAGLPASEDVDGVGVVRSGSELTTRVGAARFARNGTWDVVVDEVNTVPYFSPLWSRSPAVLFIPQLAREVWWYEAPCPLAAIGYSIEPLCLQSYRNTPVITISRSTCDDLRALGLRARIDVIPMAVSTPALKRLPPKEPRGRLVSIGRLVQSKRFDHAIEAVRVLRRAHPDVQLTIVGDGPDRERLEGIAADARLGDAVDFVGRVPEETKVRLLQDADLLVSCAVREGWGLTITEAARLGVPSVAYDVAGLRDSIVSDRTGVLTAASPSALAAEVAHLLDHRQRYHSLRANAWAAWRDLDWSRTAASFERALEAAADLRASP
jgi:glycosyltransferase involved in cell wall biosynthesis